MNLSLVLVVLINSCVVLFSRGLDSYIVYHSCKDSTCVYDYTVKGTIQSKRGSKEELIKKLTVFLSCESVGVFEGENVTYYCIDVENVSSVIQEVKWEETIVLENGSSADTKAYMMDSKMSQKFCFVRNENGKILSVFFPPNESDDIVNFKKAIVSAFQANFAETETEEENDSQSRHISHYTYSLKGNRRNQHRTIDYEDIIKFSGNSSRRKFDFYTQEDIEIDEEKIIYRSQGRSRIGISLGVNNQVEHISAHEEKIDENFEDEDIPQLKVESSYTLELQKCIPDDSSDPDDNFNDKQQREKRSLESLIPDYLIAKWNESQHYHFELKKIYNHLPDLLNSIQQMSSSNRNIRRSHYSKWRRLLWIESKNGPLPGMKPAKHILIDQLHMALDDQTDEGHRLRLLMYSLLSFEGSLLAQQALLKALDNCHSTIAADECKSISLAIGTISSVDDSIMSKLKTLLNDIDNEQLLLAFAALGRHANVEKDVVNIILGKLNASLVNKSSTNDDVIYFIHALGNTGSKLIVPHLLTFLLSWNPNIQLTAIDASRTVSRDNRIQEAFNSIIKHTTSIEAVQAILKSLIFPFEYSLYSSQMLDLTSVNATETEEVLIKNIIKASIEFNDTELHQLTRCYLGYFSRNYSSEVDAIRNSEKRFKREGTQNWDSNEDEEYNVIASETSRTQDEIDFLYHKSYLWTDEVGINEVKAIITAGGFSGVGVKGAKLFAKGVFKLFLFNETYTAVEAEFLAEKSLVSKLSVNSYIKVAGMSVLNSNYTNELTYTFAWMDTFTSIPLLSRDEHIQGNFHGYDFTLVFSSNLDVDVGINLKLGGLESAAVTNFEPLLTLTGEVTVSSDTAIGISFTATIDYFVSPQANVSFCVLPANDVTSCIEIYQGSKEIDIGIELFHQDHEGSPKKKAFWGLFDTHYTTDIPQHSLWGRCAVCTCPGSLLHELCNSSNASAADVIGASQCSCLGIDVVDLDRYYERLGLSPKVEFTDFADLDADHRCVKDSAGLLKLSFVWIIGATLLAFAH